MRQRCVVHETRIAIAGLLALLLAVPAFAGEIGELAAVLKFEDTRATAAEIGRFVTPGHDAEVRRRALVALGASGDAAAADLLLVYADHPDEALATAALGGLGRLWFPKAGATANESPDDRAVDLLVSMMSDSYRFRAMKSQERLRAVAARSLARIGNAEQTAALIPMLRRALVAGADAAFIDQAKAALEGLFRAKPAGARLAAEEALAHAEPSVRLHAALALGRIGDRAALPALEKALSDTDRAVRVEAARAVGRLGGPSSPTLPAGMLYAEDPVEIVGGLLAYGKGHAGVPIDRATQLLQTAAENEAATPVHLAVLDALGRRSDPPAVELLAAQIKRGGVFRLRAIRALGVAQAADELLALPTETWSIDHLTASEYVMALAACEVEPATKKLSDLLGDPVRPRILSADERGFVALVYAASIARAKTFQDRLRDYLTHDRELVRAVAAEAAAKNANAADLEALVASLRMSRESKSSDAAVTVIDALAAVATKLEGADFARRRIADEVEPFVTDSRALVRARAAALIRQITGRQTDAAFHHVASPLVDDDYERIARSLGGVTRMTAKTSRGEFTIECPNAAAPITTYRIARLADAGFYRDQIVHRVEPDFVVQSGDPLGSGWGGTGEAIRDEFARMTFTEMTVGLATSGPDTGESQWFVTHTATPHLDGAYTAFGRVTKGREVVLSLVPGDRVIEIAAEGKDVSE